MEFIKNVLRGVVMGISEVIPGVSGGTMAVLLGIYDKLIGTMSHFSKNLKESIRLFAPILIGMISAIVGFSFVITYLLEHFPMAVNFFFLGLVIGIIPMLYRRATEGEWKKTSTIPFFLMMALMIFLTVLSARNNSVGDQIIVMDSVQAVRFALVGCLAAVCLILPGISGSMMMVIFGTYYSVINAVKHLDIPYLIPAGIGILIGLIFGSKLIDYCLHHYPNATFFTILGLVLGSTVSIYLKSGFAFGQTQTVAAIITLVVGIGVSLFFTSPKMQGGSEPA